MTKLQQLLKDRLLLGSLAAAYGAFALTFRGPRTQFWDRMTLTGLALGSLSLKAEPDLRKTRIVPKDVALGLASAAGLYVVFQIGDRIARVILPKGGSEIEAIYSLRRLRSKRELATRLLTIVGPAEELFWRGVVQHHFMKIFGKPVGALLGTAAYGGAHIVTGNFTLLGAATVAGGYWGMLSAAGMSTGALIVSHAAWDVTIFLIAPTMAVTEE
ncbi:MAG: CPBP family intramembrane glutamic endopeptidase [Chloroflexota bacterium]